MVDKVKYQKDFVFTRFVHPLEGKISLSKKLPYFFDNLKTEEEINEFKEIADHSFLKMHLDSLTSYRSIRDMPKKLQQHYDYIFNKYPQFKTRLTKYDLLTQEELVLSLAENWVIIKFDQDVEFGYMKRQEKIKELAKQRNENYIPFYSKKDIIKDYSISHLLLIEFLSWEEEIFHFEPPIRVDYITSNTAYDFYTPISQNAIEHTELSKNFARIKTFDEILESYEYWSNKIDSSIDNLTNNKLFYIARLLKTAKSTHDAKIELVTLVSIIELLLTHNPLTNRFNVEDSITKQFILKTAVALHEFDTKIELEDIKSELKLIYTLRSKIAHGDFEELNKLFEKHSDLEEHVDFFIYKYCVNLYGYIQIILKLYLTDIKFIDFLKNN